MALSCRIIRKEDGNVNFVNAENGNKSQLFDKLVKVAGGKTDTALNLYALSETEDFKEVFEVKKANSRKGMMSSVKDVFDNTPKEEQKMPLNLQKDADNYYATLDGKMIGRIRTKPFKDGIKIDSSMVKGPYQKKGIGTQLYRKVVEDVLSQNKVLYSDDARTEYAERIWSGLEGKGIATKTEQGYVVTPKERVTDANGEPSAEFVLSYATNVSTPLSNQEIVEAQNAMLGFGVKDSKELFTKLNKVFTNNGIVTFNESKLKRSGLYNNYEVAKILSTPEVQASIKDTLQRLKNTDTFSIDYDSKFVVPESSELTPLGKQRSANPFQTEIEVVEAVTNIDADKIVEALPPVLASKYEQDSEFRAAVDDLNKTVKSLPVQILKDGELSDKVEDTRSILSNTLTTDSNDTLSDNIEALKKGISKETWESSLQEVSEVLKGIKEDAIDNGIDLRDIEAKAYTKTREEVLIFLESMENLMEDPSIDTLVDFSDKYDSMFEVNDKITEQIQTDNDFDIVLESDASEYELFVTNNLVKKQEGVYRKVSEQGLDELYESIVENVDVLPKNISTVEELKEYVSKNLDKLGVEDYQVDPEVLEKMYLYKTYFGFPLESKKKNFGVENMSKVSLDYDYLTDDFVREFNKWILKTGNKYFTVTEKGIELIQKDPISKQEAILSLEKELMEPLSQYDTISKHLDLGIEPQDSVSDFTDAAQKNRQIAVNNPQTVSKLKGEYAYLEDGVMAAKNETETFVRTPVGVFEMIYENNNVKFYNKLEDADPNYKMTNIEKPLSDINFAKYSHLETSPEKFSEAKKYYNKAELQKINEEYFSCK